ncbi:DNA-binding GntR family transcriptional regulator [Stackebrandtia albiflava]|uniref:DNA-binding GntR family transcriptional regulator n=1 Tax=Stackebrandtia albiflava TaxID=406432 RepID=A0A562V9Z7_9ACTN|nr:GntR family transcriptional regulator [Stackebrandtia albiflava]TWJ14637.1 DNA-binding GntR family transcriptional regulator [Stackebrandtia albiflava]
MTIDRKPDSLRDLVYRTLKRRIIEVRVPPGHRLIERDLATELDVSRIPVREALRLLSAEGLVVIVPGRGTIVSPFTPRDVRDLFDVRTGVEVLATRLAAERATEDDLARLRELLAVARRHTDDPHRLTEHNADFHNELVAVSGNRLLETLMRPLDSRLRWLFHLAVELDPVAQCREHETIYRAIAAHDVEEATRLAAQHIENSRGPTLAMAAQWSESEIDPEKAVHTRRRTPRDDRNR